MYNYVPSLSPKPGDVLSEEDISGFGSHSRFSYSLSSINGSHNNSHNSLQSLSSANGAAVCISDKYNEIEIMLDPKDKAVSSHVVECVGDLRVRSHCTYLRIFVLIVLPLLLLKGTKTRLLCDMITKRRMSSRNAT